MEIKRTDSTISSLKSSSSAIEEQIKAQEVLQNKNIALILFDKHNMKFQLQFKKLCINLTFKDYSSKSFLKEIGKMKRINLRNISEVILNNFLQK